jgi:uncharacterized metal-binding protein
MAEKCTCGGNCILVFPCSGSSDTGELADKTARKMAKEGFGRMFCLAGIGAHIDGMIESTKSAGRIIAIDGCPVSCATKTLEHAGFKPESYSLKEAGFQKGKTTVDDKSVEKILELILKEKE